jgi:hypothetical protein
MPDVPLTGQNPTLLFHDRTPNAIILNRVLLRSIELAQCTDLSREEGSEFIDLVVLLSRKMLSVWKHMEAYGAQEQQLKEKFWKNPDIPRENSQDLYEEFDVFAVQVKSTLDHLVKVMRIILGRKWTMYTFANKGDGVYRALQGTVKKNQEGHLRVMAHQLFNDVNKKWLSVVIESRDQVNHGLAGGIRIERFQIGRNADGSVQMPMWNKEQAMVDAMDMVWRNLFLYMEDFIALALNFRVRDDFSFARVEKPLTTAEPTWRAIERRTADALVESFPSVKKI